MSQANPVLDYQLSRLLETGKTMLSVMFSMIEKSNDALTDKI